MSTVILALLLAFYVLILAFDMATTHFYSGPLLDPQTVAGNLVKKYFVYGGSGFICRNNVCEYTADSPTEATIRVSCDKNIAKELQGCKDDMGCIVEIR